jgi:hypothetical protein
MKEGLSSKLKAENLHSSPLTVDRQETNAMPYAPCAMPTKTGSTSIQ